MLAQRESIYIVWIALTYMMFSTFLRCFFQLFSCTTLGGTFSIPKLQGAFDVMCSLSDGNYLTFTAAIGAPTALFLIIGMPALVFIVIYRSDRNDERVISVYGGTYIYV
jgi:hypothetical protein